jgi:hypothetical protein
MNYELSLQAVRDQAPTFCALTLPIETNYCTPSSTAAGAATCAASRPSIIWTPLKIMEREHNPRE